MRRLFILGFIFLVGCSALNLTHYKCTQVLIIIYNEKGIFEESQFFLGNLRKSNLPIYKGTIVDLKYLGHPPQRMGCDTNLDWGFYQIWYGSQLIVGEGYGNTVYVRNINFLPLKKGGEIE